MRARTKRNLFLGGLATLVGYALFAKPKPTVKTAAPGAGSFGDVAHAPPQGPGAPATVTPLPAGLQAFPPDTPVGRTIGANGPLGKPVSLAANYPATGTGPLPYNDPLRIRTPNTSAKDAQGQTRLTKYTIVFLRTEDASGMSGLAVAYEFPDGTYVPAPPNTPFVHFQRATIEGYAAGYANGAPSVGGGGTGS